MGYSDIIMECCGEFSQTFNINFNNMSFTGEYNNIIDQKKRLSIPAKYRKSLDIVNGKTDQIKKAENYDRFELENVILWWKKKAQSRFNTLKGDGRLRNDMEIWTKDSQIDIIR